MNPFFPTFLIQIDLGRTRFMENLVLVLFATLIGPKKNEFLFPKFCVFRFMTTLLFFRSLEK